MAALRGCVAIGVSNEFVEEALQLTYKGDDRPRDWARSEMHCDLHARLRLARALNEWRVAHVAWRQGAPERVRRTPFAKPSLSAGGAKWQPRRQNAYDRSRNSPRRRALESQRNMADAQPPPRRSKRKHKSVAELERRARALFQQEGEELYEGSDASVDIADLSDQQDEVDSDFDAPEQMHDGEQQARQAEREVRRAERAERAQSKKKGAAPNVGWHHRAPRARQKLAAEEHARGVGARGGIEGHQGEEEAAGEARGAVRGADAAAAAADGEDHRGGESQQSQGPAATGGGEETRGGQEEGACGREDEHEMEGWQLYNQFYQGRFYRPD
ncbi:hypothetical protein FGB62_112g02 [Gracilaria domingensis]|nr:hypothetical protein FGB62_112g02 [Gracilaria domingensis]